MSKVAVAEQVLQTVATLKEADAEGGICKMPAWLHIIRCVRLSL